MRRPVPPLIAAALAALLLGEGCSGAVARTNEREPVSVGRETTSRDDDSSWIWWTAAGVATAAAVTAIVAVVIVRGAESGARGAGRSAADTGASSGPLGTF